MLLPPVTEIGSWIQERQLYLYIAYAFSVEWNAVLDDIDDRVVTAAELLGRCQKECTDLTIAVISKE